jgi:hypothetical protein
VWVTKTKLTESKGFGHEIRHMPHHSTEYLVSSLR